MFYPLFYCVYWANKPILTGFQSPAKAVYNARHWNQPEPEEIPVPSLSRAQTAPVKHCIARSSSLLVLCLVLLFCFFSTSMLTVTDCDCFRSSNCQVCIANVCIDSVHSRGNNIAICYVNWSLMTSTICFRSSPFSAVHTPRYCLLAQLSTVSFKCSN